MDGASARTPITPFAGVASVAAVNGRVGEVVEARRFQHVQGNARQVVARQHVTGQGAPVGVNAEIIPPRAADVLMRRAKVAAVNQPFHEVVIGQVRFDDLQSILQGAGQCGVVRRESVVRVMRAVEVQVEHEAVFERKSRQRGDLIHVQARDGDDEVGFESHLEGEQNGLEDPLEGRVAVADGTLAVMPLTESIQRNGEAEAFVFDELQPLAVEQGGVGDQHLGQIQTRFPRKGFCPLVQGGDQIPVHGRLAAGVLDLDFGVPMRFCQLEQTIHRPQTCFQIHAAHILADEAMRASEVAGAGEVEPGFERRCGVMVCRDVWLDRCLL